MLLIYMSNPYFYSVSFTNCPFTAGVSYSMTDQALSTPVVIPQGSYISRVYFNTGTFSSNATLSVGWSGNTDAIVPASAGVTTNTLNNVGIQYIPGGVTQFTSQDQTILLTSDSNVTSGSVGVVIEYIGFGNFADSNDE